MFITVHAAAAALIGERLTSAPIGFLIGLLSHYLLDIPPHGDQKLGKSFFAFKLRDVKEHMDTKSFALYAVLDGLFLALFLIFLFKNFSFATNDATVWTIIGGILPDILMIIYKLTEWKILKWTFVIHKANHFLLLNRIKSDMPLKWGIIMQTTIFIIFIGLLYL